jgi:hypothetical protein
MTKPIRLLAFLLLLLLTSCSGNMGQPVPPVAPPPISGSFSFTGTSQAFNSKTIFIGGTLQSDSDGHVLGNLGITTNPNVTTCFPQGNNAIFTGTISGGLLMLTSAPVAGQVITLSATVSTDGNFFSKATYSVAGGCLGGDQGGMVVSHLLAGTYTGSFIGGGVLINASVNFNQPGLFMPDIFGEFPINAAATFKNTSSCGGFSSARIEGGQQLGLDVSFAMDSNVTGTRLIFNGSSIDSSGTMFTGTVVIVGGPCNGTQGAITLKKA